ncbi:MAG: ribbon-helix-helix protein, CopG family [Desulfohalobiaceae bacterium]|nr:ribbon-helix-helix protein, CopG family [Desulfohalobiaceae bacterium]
MVRTQIRLSEKQASLVKSISAEKGISVSEVIRRAIDSMDSSSLDNDAGKKRELALEAMGKFSSGTGDVSERYDEYLSQAFQG